MKAPRFAYARPASVAEALALRATFVVAGKKGERRIAAGDFFRGLYATALKPGELLVAAEFPLPRPGYASAFGELARRHGDYAMVGVAAHGSRKGGKFSDLRVAVFCVGDRPTIIAADTVSGVLSKLETHLEPRAGPHPSAALKLHPAKLLA